MQLTIPTNSLDTKVIIEFPSLEELLKNAPKDISYDPHNNGFYLMNKALRIEYTQVYFLGNNGVGLWFFGHHPKIKVSTEFTDMRLLPKSLLCSNITAHTGDTWCFTFQAYEGGPQGNTFGISLFDHFGDKKVTPEQEKWFDYGTKLLQKAAVKYNLAYWYDTYKGKGHVIEGNSRPSLSSRIRRLLPF